MSDEKNKTEFNKSLVFFDRALDELHELAKIVDVIEKETGVKVNLTITRVAGVVNDPLDPNAIKLPGIAALMKPGSVLNLDDINIKRKN